MAPLRVPRTCNAAAANADGSEPITNISNSSSKESIPTDTPAEPPAMPVSPASPAAVAPVKRGLAAAFDSLAPRTQLIIISGFFIVAMIGLPFLQPTFLYGDASRTTSSTPQADAMVIDNPVKQSKPIPFVTPVLEGLQRLSMPRTLPDGRTESPGVVRIYLASMIILAVFYALSAFLQVITNGVLAMLRAAGVLKGTGTSQPQSS